jgi:uncharacterized membrane protein YfcA
VKSSGKFPRRGALRHLPVVQEKLAGVHQRNLYKWLIVAPMIGVISGLAITVVVFMVLKEMWPAVLGYYLQHHWAIVPGLVFSTGMPLIMAIGSSLFSVGTFGLTTAVNYALSGLVDWLVVLEYVGGGFLGGFLGARLATRLSGQKRVLNYVFSGIVVVVALYMLDLNISALHL